MAASVVAVVDVSSRSWFFLDFTELPLGFFGNSSSPFSKGSVSSESESNCCRDLRFFCEECEDDGVFFLLFVLMLRGCIKNLCSCWDQ